jgi:hypothetical protein
LDNPIKFPEPEDMSKELQDKAERMIKELEDALIPISEEIKIRKSQGN